jgi:hypothetical protein
MAQKRSATGGLCSEIDVKLVVARVVRMGSMYSAQSHTFQFLNRMNNLSPRRPGRLRPVIHRRAWPRGSQRLRRVGERGPLRKARYRGHLSFRLSPTSGLGFILGTKPAFTLALIDLRPTAIRSARQMINACSTLTDITFNWAFTIIFRRAAIDVGQRNLTLVVFPFRWSNLRGRRQTYHGPHAA